MTINPDGRQSLGALSGSREPDPSCTGSGPSGFDPEREPDIEVCTNCGAYYEPRKGQDYYDTRCEQCGKL